MGVSRSSTAANPDPPIGAFARSTGPACRGRRSGRCWFQFAERVANARYSVLVSPPRTADAPMIAANYGDVQTTGFVVILFNPVAPREYQTVRNGDFSFIVMS